MCGLFIAKIESKVYLIHQTAREFLVAKAELEQTAAIASSQLQIWKHSLRPADSHFILSDICITYLSSDVFVSQTSKDTKKVGTGEGFDREILVQHFLDYVATYWPFHFKAATSPDNEKLRHSALRICDARTDHLSRWFFLHCFNHGHLDKGNRKANIPLFLHDRTPGIGPPSVSPLLIACFLGLTTLVQHLLHQNIKRLDQGDTRYKRTPLSWAALHGHYEVVDLILRQEGVQLNSKDIHNQTTLLLAARYGHLDTVKLLLEQDDIVTSGRILWLAMENRDPNMFELLLGSDNVDIDDRDESGLTPLNWRYLMDDPGSSGSFSQGTTSSSTAKIATVRLLFSQLWSANTLKSSSSCLIRTASIWKPRIKMG